MYVDDLLIIGKEKTVSDFKVSLEKISTVTDLGEFKYFFGIKIVRSPSGLFLSQKDYTERVIEAAGMKTAKP